MLGNIVLGLGLLVILLGLYTLYLYIGNKKY